jgi:hypothetical protein
MTEPDRRDDKKINLLRINRNAILLADSDMESETAQVKERVGRLQQEMKELHLLTWVTLGREVENYIPTEALRKFYKNGKLPELRRYQRLHAAPGDKEPEEDKAYVQEHGLRKDGHQKVRFARDISGFFTKENLGPVLDLAERIKEVIHRIESWNK